MTFGEYVKRRTKELDIPQQEFPELSQPYLSLIISGARHPQKRSFFKKLAKGLQLPESEVDWLQMFCALDHDPMNSFIPEDKNEDGDNKLVTTGTLQEQVVALLGPPDVVLGNQQSTKWIYKSLDTYIVLCDGIVEEVHFI